MKNFSPIVALRVRGWFGCHAVEAVRSDGSTERMNVCPSLGVAQESLAARAGRRGWPVAADGMSARLPED